MKWSKNADEQRKKVWHSEEKKKFTEHFSLLRFSIFFAFSFIHCCSFYAFAYFLFVELPLSIRFDWIDRMLCYSVVTHILCVSSQNINDFSYTLYTYSETNVLWLLTCHYFRMCVSLSNTQTSIKKRMKLDICVHIEIICDIVLIWNKATAIGIEWNQKNKSNNKRKAHRKNKENKRHFYWCDYFDAQFYPRQYGARIFGVFECMYRS